MKPKDPNLPVGTQDKDMELSSKLKLLGYNVQPGEVEENVSGDSVHQFIKDFQRKRGLKPTREVDARTARLINAAVDALPPREFVVKGRILHKDDSKLDNLTVRAFDKNLRREELLGEATSNKDGDYKISYKTDQLARAEKRSAKLIVRTN